MLFNEKEISKKDLLLDINNILVICISLIKCYRKKKTKFDFKI